MNVIFSDRAISAVMAETAEKIRTETGGLFLGKVVGENWYIIEAIDPGPNSVFEVAYFEYDQPYVQHLINKVANLYQSRLDLIGLWHRHPGPFDQFSGTDDGTNTAYAAMRPQGAISALVNLDPHFRLTIYHVAQPCSYTKTGYQVGNALIPPELLAYHTPETYRQIMEQLMGGASRAAGAITGGIKLSDFLDKMVAGLTETEMPSQVLLFSEAQREAVVGHILEEILPDMEYMSGQKIPYLLQKDQSSIWLMPKDQNKNLSMRFCCRLPEREVCCVWRGRSYIYHSGAFQKLGGDRTSLAQPRPDPLEPAEPNARVPRSDFWGEVIKRVVKLGTEWEDKKV